MSRARLTLLWRTRLNIGVHLPDFRLRMETRGALRFSLLSLIKIAYVSPVRCRHGWVANLYSGLTTLVAKFTMKLDEQTDRRSAVETDREPWELCSAREEIGITVLYLAERLCYRVAFLMSGFCNRCLLAAGDYWRARRERLAHVHRGLRDEGNIALIVPSRKARRRHGGAKRRARGTS
jgi:hypothetical protein